MQPFFKRLAHAYGLSAKTLDTHIGEQFVTGEIKPNIDVFLDWRIHISSLMNDPLFHNDIHNLQLEIEAVDEFLCHFFSCQNKQGHDKRN